MLTQVTAIFAKNRRKFFFKQQLLQRFSQHVFGLHGQLDREMFHATCVATPL
jgi:predicted component of type VI protein secretion system